MSSVPVLQLIDLQSTHACVVQISKDDMWCDHALQGHLGLLKSHC